MSFFMIYLNKPSTPAKQLPHFTHAFTKIICLGYNVFVNSRYLTDFPKFEFL